jgi:hypothetical protein
MKMAAAKNFLIFPPDTFPGFAREILSKGWSSTLQRLMKAVCQRGKKTTSGEPVENFAGIKQVFWAASFSAN